jgi:hypothetical protein
MRARAILTYSFGRFAFLLLWSLVAWGALLIASAVADSFSEGSTAFARLVPTQEATVWGWLGALSVAVALTVGLIAGAVFASRVTRGSNT